ncbi:MAG: DNA primase catalytic subunit PriS [Candidatus Altiarchaeales archaeon]|nr:MAG: hypothetical protein B6U86_06025 [Candidatus Altiarchaeales archaeon ex4484_43]RLI87795.1 MAG: DNA primase catalytic subunit PriS [Candidatus Altiarchaeales archaeon]HDI72792.1 DNA primase catalytic subunit PriS [Candidatus Altiarchaeales archaeon]
MNTETKIFLKKKFREYYARHRIPAPEEIERREFGVGTLKDKIKIRHKSFKSERELQNFLRREAPFFISYSAAYYEFPQNQPMKEKNWLGAELVFDLDIEMDFLDASRLQRVRDEAINLVDFLVEDFGISERDIQVNFSGSKGYHIHVLNEKIKNLGSDERREIVDYIAGDINFVDYLKVEGDKILGPKKGDRGWYGRIYEELYNLIKNSNQKELEKIPGIGEKKARLIYEGRERILKELELGRYNYMSEIITVNMSYRRTEDPNVREPIIKGVSSPLVQKIIEDRSVNIKKAEDTDKMVTIDTSRLIRLPETLHGGSGLIAKKVKDLEKFDPLREAIAFGEEKVKIELKEKVPEFEIKGERFGPFKEGSIEIPEFVGIYLLLKDKGDIVQSSTP